MTTPATPMAAAAIARARQRAAKPKPALKPLVSLQDYLDAAYLHTVGVVRRPVDPVHDLAKAGFDRRELEARHAALAAIPDRRCVISRVQRDCLKRALDLIG